MMESNSPQRLPKTSELVFYINGRKIIESNVDPEITLLQYLRLKLRLTGSKLGCGEGGCGACTVMVSRYNRDTDQINHISVVACLYPLCCCHGMAVTTVEGIGSTARGLHPVQERIVKAHASQCGFCTPGMVMSMYALLRNNPLPSMADVKTAIEGNLCRCTGYRGILDGLNTFTKECSLGAQCCRNGDVGNDGAQEESISSELSRVGEFTPFDPSQEPIFPTELQLSKRYDEESLVYQGPKVTWFRPVSLSELLKLKSTYPEAKLFNGIGMWFRPNDSLYPVIISTSHCPQLREIKYHKRGMRFGAAVNVTEMINELESAVNNLPEYQTRLFAALLDSLKCIGGRQVRNVTTIGGNIISARSSSDIVPLLLSAGAVLYTQSPDTEQRKLKIDPSFFKGSGQVALTPHEVMVSVLVPYSNKWEYYCSYKQGYKRENDMAIVNAGMKVLFEENTTVSDLSLCYGGMASTTVLAQKTKAGAVGRLWDDDLVSEVCRLLPEDLPLSPGSTGGMTEYRHTLVTSFFFRFYLTVQMQLQQISGAVKNKIPDSYRSGGDDLKSGPCQSSQLCEEMTPEQPKEDPVGRAISHLSGSSHVTGESVFIDDMPTFSDELFLSRVVSTRAHARILSVDPTEALAMPGVMDYVSYIDVPGSNKWGFDEELFATDEVSAQGQTIGAILAETRTCAKQAAKVVKVEYEDLDVTISIQKCFLHTQIPHTDVVAKTVLMNSVPFPIFALGDNCPPLVAHLVKTVLSGLLAQNHRVTSKRRSLTVRGESVNIFAYSEEEYTTGDNKRREPPSKDAIKTKSFYGTPLILQNGDLGEGFEEADHMIEGHLNIGGQEHFYMETQSCIAIPQTEEGEMEIISATQFPHYTQDVCAKALGVPANRVVCKTKRLGGGFGGKILRSNMVAGVCAVAAKKSGRAVRCILDRDEDMTSTGGRHPFFGKYKVGFTSRGKVTALELNFYGNGGNTLDASMGFLKKSMFFLCNGYKVTNVRLTGRVCKTNIPPTTPFRAFAVAPPVIFCESWITDIAVSLGISQLQIREVNMLKEGDLTHYNQLLENYHLRDCWDQCLVQSDFHHRRKDVDIFNSENRWKKRGIAVTPISEGIGIVNASSNQAGALVHVYTDGSVLLTHGGIEMGQGLHTKMIQVASRVLRVPQSRIFISSTSSDKVPNASASGASVCSDLNGMAVMEACTTIIRRLDPYIQDSPNGTWGDWVNAAYQDRVSLSSTGYYKTPGLDYDEKTNKGNVFAYFTTGVACSEVEIDCLTGDRQILRTDVVMDIGTSLNPAIDIGQIEGAFLQGCGLLLMEQQKITPSGYHLTRGPRTYKIPGAGDIPTVFNVTLMKGMSNPKAVYSSKGVGEPALVLAISAFLAVKDAIMSARVDSGLHGNFQYDSPATPEKVRMACVDQFTKQFPSADPGTYTPWYVDPL